MMYNQLLKLSHKFKDFEEKLKLPLIAPEEQETLFIRNINEDRELLLKYNIVPLEVGENFDPLLGYGGSCNVYHVLYKSKTAVAKITTSIKDVNNMRKLYEFRNKFPAKYRKHIAKVFDVIKDGDNYIIVVEKLITLNKHVADLFDGPKNNQDLKVFLNSLNESFFSKFFNYWNIKEFLSDRQIKLLINDSVNYFINLDGRKLKDFFSYQDRNYLELFVRSYKNDILKDLPYAKANDMVYYLINYINNILNFRTTFPSSFNNYELLKERDIVLPFQTMPETRSLFEFLILLKEKFGIKFSDVTDFNVMERPGTKDIVISDPGLFQGL